jgi:hypothetical protein
MAAISHSGPTTLLQASGQTSGSTAGTTAQAGSWHRWPPNIHSIGFCCNIVGTSAVSTATATVNIEVCNDGLTAASTPILSFSGITLTTDSVTLAGVAASSMPGPWAYVRANLTSLTTATAASTGSPAVVTVTANGGHTGQM